MISNHNNDESNNNELEYHRAEFEYNGKMTSVYAMSQELGINQEHLYHAVVIRRIAPADAVKLAKTNNLSRLKTSGDKVYYGGKRYNTLKALCDEAGSNSKTIFSYIKQFDISRETAGLSLQQGIINIGNMDRWVIAVGHGK